MWATCFLFFLIWIGFLWTLIKPTTQELSKNIEVKEPIFQRNCNKNTVACVDDCSFLCVEDNIKCIGGVCKEGVPDIPCNKEKGGIVMMVEEPIPHWSCICTNSTFFSGNDCETLNSDICEHGTFMYSNRNDYKCFCLEPYKYLEVNNKPHCVEKNLTNFFK